MENSNICKFNFNMSSDLLCSRFIYESTDHQNTPKKAERFAIHLAVKGNGVFVCNGERYEISKGTLFFALKGDTFYIERTGALEYTYICFHGRRATEYMERIGIAGTNRIFAGHEKLISFWLDCLANTNDGNIDLYSESVLLYTLAQLQPHEKEQCDVITKIIALTGDNFSDPSLSLATIAAQVGYHAKYISALFTKQIGMTYTQYLRDLRMKHALFLMEQGIVSVKNVAILSGFQDALYFSKIFKQAMGVSPKEYIQKLNK